MPFDLLDVKASVSDAVKAHTVGTHRVMAPEQTLARVARIWRQLVAPAG